jgi:hypothetical protein
MTTSIFFPASIPFLLPLICYNFPNDNYPGRPRQALSPNIKIPGFRRLLPAQSFMINLYKDLAEKANRFAASNGLPGSITGEQALDDPG